MRCIECAGRIDGTTHDGTSFFCGPKNDGAGKGCRFGHELEPKHLFVESPDWCPRKTADESIGASHEETR